METLQPLLHLVHTILLSRRLQRSPRTFDPTLGPFYLNLYQRVQQLLGSCCASLAGIIQECTAALEASSSAATFCEALCRYLDISVSLSAPLIDVWISRALEVILMSKSMN